MLQLFSTKVNIANNMINKTRSKINICINVKNNLKIVVVGDPL